MLPTVRLGCEPAGKSAANDKAKRRKCQLTPSEEVWEQQPERPVPRGIDDSFAYVFSDLLRSSFLQVKVLLAPI
jgi:hypothetical protein